MSADEAREPVEVTGCVRVLDRRLGLPVLLAPDRGAAAENRNDGRLAPLQLGPEEVSELAVVAVRPAAMVEWDEKEIGLVERLELPPRALGLEDGVAERPAHGVEDRCPGEEADVVGAEPREELEVEVVGDEAVVASGHDAPAPPSLSASAAR